MGPSDHPIIQKKQKKERDKGNEFVVITFGTVGMGSERGEWSFTSTCGAHIPRSSPTLALGPRERALSLLSPRLKVTHCCVVVPMFSCCTHRDSADKRDQGGLPRVVVCCSRQRCVYAPVLVLHR